jgi:hypothetical protein
MDTAFALPTSVSGIQAVQKKGAQTKAQAEKDAKDEDKKKAADLEKIKKMKALGVQMAQGVDPTKIQPMLPGIQGPTDITPAEKQYKADVLAVPVPLDGKDQPAPAVVPLAYAPPPLALKTGAAQAAPTLAPANTTEQNLEEFKSAIGSQDKFRKAGFMDILNAAASGWVGRESEYSKQRDAWQARNDAMLATARDEAIKLKMMAEEYRMRGDERSASAADQAAENAKDRALRREEMTAKKTAEGGDAMAQLVQKFLGGK